MSAHYTTDATSLSSASILECLLPPNDNADVMNTPSMLRPQEAEYGSREELLSEAQKWALGQGYAVTIKRSVTGKYA
ncbi:unnamed protein product [Albugo candida]|uniref:Uncharacterized protein n=1 Tax=Albugo candida TaxID=65357 RepID=A0A024FWZ5_9STRA|nr:unnamed protein product [Albugo candida]|eukprot:CCI11640.1 unnamed protein product [Albugo candida]